MNPNSFCALVILTAISGGTILKAQNRMALLTPIDGELLGIGVLLEAMRGL